MDRHEVTRRLPLGLRACKLEKVTDSDAILEMGVLTTPGYAFDGALQKFGKVYSQEEIAESLKRYLGE